MNYMKHYVKLIRNAQVRILNDKYVEQHHIFPRSIFGENDKLVPLTYKEHYVAHMLLFRIFKKRYGINHGYTRRMAMAIHRMVYSSKSKEVIINGNMYYEARKRVVDAKTGALRQDLKGKKYFGASEETIIEIKRKVSLAKKGVPTNYPAHRKPSGPCPQEKRNKISESRKKTNQKYVDMSKEEFDSWLSKQSLYDRNNHKNKNVTRALISRGEDVSKYYGTK